MKARNYGFTLVEVLISMAVLGAIIVVVATSWLPLAKATQESGIAQGQDQVGRRVLTELRRDLRATGWQQAGAVKFTVYVAGAADTPATGAVGDEIRFRKRLGPMTNDDSKPIVDPAPWGWSTEITYRRVPDGAFTGIGGAVPTRYRLERVQDGQIVVLARDVSDFTVQNQLNAQTVLAHLEVTKNNPSWSGSTPPPALTRSYDDRVEMLNKQ